MASARALSLLADVVTLANASPTRADFEQAVLSLLERSIGFDIAFVSVPDGGRPEVTLTGLEPERSAAGLGDPVFISTLARRGAVYSQELMPVARFAFARRGVAVDTEVLPSATVQRSAYHASFAARSEASTRSWPSSRSSPAASSP